MDTDNDGIDTAPATTAFAPAYGLAGRSSSAGPQCSAHDEFCFFCSFEKDPHSERGSTADLYGSLIDLVRAMNADGKEFPSLVSAVREAYEEQIRPHVSHPHYGDGPAWSEQSISRHLMFSTQFSGVFRTGVTQIFHSLVSSHNEHLMDACTGQVIESERQALMSTLAMLMKWERHAASGSGSGSASTTK